MSIRALIAQADSGEWLEARGLTRVLAAPTPAAVPEVLAETEALVRQRRLHAVGFVSYEAAPGLDFRLCCHPPGSLPPAWFGLFERCEAVPPPPAEAPPVLDWQPSLDRDGYGDAIARIREYLAAGDTYQVNFSYRLRATLGGDGIDAQALFAAMNAGQRRGLGAFIDTGAWAICSASPELFFSRQGRRLVSRPMKGTAARAAGDEDQARARWLAGSAKNRAENTMITDMVRNDLGRIAVPGSMTTEGLFKIEAYPTVWQMTSTVAAESDAGLVDVFRALFPAASITGAPKHRTMEIIRELEPEPRGIYTGAIGHLAPDGSAHFSVAIRTALVDRRRGCVEYGVGGGIVWDSKADEEHAETLAKARILHRVAGRDEGFELLETLLWEPAGGLARLERHLQRLTAAGDYFHRPVVRTAVTAALDAATSDLPAEPHRVRLLVDVCGRVSATAQPLGESPPPRRVTIAHRPLALAGNPFVRHKTTRRDVYEVARRENLGDDGADDVLLVNLAGEITEATIANVVVDLDGVLATPPAQAGLLPGVYREALLAGGHVVERSITPADVRRARAVYLANSVRGMWPVTLV